MKKIKLYITASIDGFIAGPNGDLDLIMSFKKTSDEDYGFADFLKSVDTILMGGEDIP